MPVNKSSLIRYRTIDKCLQNRRRRWTIEDLINACNEAVYEYEGSSRSVSLRTIRMDLQAMRSEQLGYNAPIVVRDKKYYTYEDPHYSITDIPLTPQDLGLLQEISKLLSQFKGFSHFNEMGEMINKLEDKIYSEQYHVPAVIDFEKNDLLTGIEWLDPLYKAIVSQTTVCIGYQSFKARAAEDLTFYPYLLKEYRNRWFVLGLKKKGREIMTLALDRIQKVETRPEELFHLQKEFDARDWFAPIIGVTRNINTMPVEVHFLANHVHAPYIRTKPLHPTQKILEEGKTSVRFTITVIPNFELERELISFGEGIKVLSPNSLVRQIRRRVRLMNELYLPDKD